MRKIFIFLGVLFVLGGCSHRVLPENLEPVPMRSNVHYVEPQLQPEPQPVVEPAKPKRRLSFMPRFRRQTTTVPVEPVQLGLHETEFDTSEENRNVNIKLATDSINGKIVKPGEIFSYNDAVGPTVEDRGYKKSTVYANGVKKQNFGGGVCQVSTTLHNAAKNAGMEIVERHDHSLPVTYAKSGEEAATSYGVIDFKFKNNKEHPVQIVGSVEGNKIIVSIKAA